MKNVEDVKQAMREIGACITDPMWADHAEVSKKALKLWHLTLLETLLKKHAVDDTPFVAMLRNWVLTAGPSAELTINRDQLVELLGGNFQMLDRTSKEVIARHSTECSTDESSTDDTFIPNTLAGFVSGFRALHKRNPTHQELWNAAVKSAIARRSTEEITKESPVADWMLRELFERQQEGFERCYEALGITDQRERSWSALVLALSKQKPDWKFKDEDYASMLRATAAAHYDGFRTGEMLREVASLIDRLDPKPEADHG